MFWGTRYGWCQISFPQNNTNEKTVKLKTEMKTKCVNLEFFTSEISFKKGEVGLFADIQKLGKNQTLKTRDALQEMLKYQLLTKENDARWKVRSRWGNQSVEGNHVGG